MKFLRFLKGLFLVAYIAFLAVICISPFRDVSAQSAESGTAAPAASHAPLIDIHPVEKIEFAAGKFPADAEELTLTVDASELPLLDSFSALKRVDFSGSTCYAELADWAEKHPDVAVTYTVALPDGTVAALDETKLDLTGVTAAQKTETLALLQYLPKLNKLTLGSVGSDKVFSGEDVAALREQFPDATLDYTFTLLGQEVDPMAETLDLSTLGHEEAAGAAALVSGMPNLKEIELGSDDGRLSWDDLALFRLSVPEVQLRYSCSYWGRTINLADETLNFSHVRMDDEGASIMALLPYMHNLKVLDMDSCGVSNESMAVIRDTFPNVDVIWRIWFAQGYSVRTDVIKILASKPSKAGYITDQDAQALQYCTKLKYLDVGHNETLHDISFCRSMPDLEVVIFTMTGVTDISPLADCPHLEYLEVTHTAVSDLSPLANSTELRHLNVGDSRVSDISPLYGLTELERLWLCMGTNVPYDQVQHMRECAPNCEINLDADDPSLGAWRFSDLNDDGWAYFSKYGVFKFVNHPRYELLRQQFGYDNEEYSFYWLDPLY